jgi:prepilin-type N-terminal cleavage/methylation domain-containing protein
MNACRNRTLLRAAVGFTLIELLVVVGVIGMLAALLFPVLASARRSAHTVTCASNLRQLALAIQMYEADYEGALPRQVPFFRPAGGSDPLRPYAGVRAFDTDGNAGPLYRCPDAHTLGTRFGTYNFRFAIFDPDPSDPAKTILKHIRPTADSVLAHCYWHVEKVDVSVWPPPGYYMVARENGAAQRIPTGAVERWEIKDGKWCKMAPGDIPYHGYTPVFPGEPWPLQTL